MKVEKKGTCILTLPKFEFRECKLTFLDDVEVAKLMRQENLAEIGILFMSENIIYIKCVTASSIVAKNSEYTRIKQKGLRPRKMAAMSRRKPFQRYSCYDGILPFLCLTCELFINLSLLFSSIINFAKKVRWVVTLDIIVSCSWRMKRRI